VDPRFDGLLDQGGDVTLGRKKPGVDDFSRFLGKSNKLEKWQKSVESTPPGKSGVFDLGIPKNDVFWVFYPWS
jgi:hypothetical protein